MKLKNEGLPAASLLLALGVTGCASASGPKMEQPAPVPTATTATAQATQAPAPRPAQLNRIAYALPTDWKPVYWNGFGAGRQYVEAHYETGRNDANQIAVKFYVADNDGTRLTTVRGNSTPEMIYGCNNGYLSLIKHGRFTAVASPADSPACDPDIGPRLSNLPQPADIYGRSIGDVVFSQTNSIGSGD